MQQIKEAVKNRDVDELLNLTKKIEDKDVEEALKLYEEFYLKESEITKFVFQFTNETRVRKERRKFVDIGFCTYELE
ncbi:hypothetical protein NUSPORA_02293 [Nucleospora cyclopteri]